MMGSFDRLPPSTSMDLNDLLYMFDKTEGWCCIVILFS
jgi:hypothetical protein